MVVISFVASASGSGKTTLIEKVVRILKARGLRVAVIKHTSAGFDLDRPGKDSWRFQEAGADAVFLIGPGKLALMKKTEREPSFRELEQMALDADIIIQEGFKRDAVNKIEVFRAGASGDQPLCMSDPSCIALVSDTTHHIEIPCYDLNDAEGVADFILKRSAAGGAAGRQR